MFVCICWTEGFIMSDSWPFVFPLGVVVGALICLFVGTGFGGGGRAEESGWIFFGRDVVCKDCS